MKGWIAKRISAWQAAALALLLIAPHVHAQDRPEGLLWNRTGLAATLPLQVKTNPGTDHLLVLRDLTSEQEVFAAYIRGGNFFRVLVPPGEFEVLFASGTEWQGETALFGPDTRWFALKAPLAFGATVDRKKGHLIDLRDPQRIEINDYALCQTIERDPDSLRRPDAPEDPPVGQRDDPLYLEYDFPVPRYQVRSRICG